MANSSLRFIPSTGTTTPLPLDWVFPRIIRPAQIIDPRSESRRPPFGVWIAATVRTRLNPAVWGTRRRRRRPHCKGCTRTREPSCHTRRSSSSVSVAARFARPPSGRERASRRTSAPAAATSAGRDPPTWGTPSADVCACARLPRSSSRRARLSSWDSRAGRNVADGGSENVGPHRLEEIPVLGLIAVSCRLRAGVTGEREAQGEHGGKGKRNRPGMAERSEPGEQAHRGVSREQQGRRAQIVDEVALRSTRGQPRRRSSRR